MSMLVIDGSHGEGGGQILRSSLALSMITGTAFRIAHIRAGRRRPGLMRQHLAAVQAAAAVCGARVTGAEVGSTELVFRPDTPRAGTYTFAVGTAGSATLVLQTVLPALVLTAGRSALTLEGGTHNPHAPPWDFLARAYLPLLGRMGPAVDTVLERPGFYPAGGGRFRVEIAPVRALERIDLGERGAVRERRVVVKVASLSRRIAQREIDVLVARLGWPHACFCIDVVRDATGPGNAIVAEVESEHVTEVFTGFGTRGVRAETVAEAVAGEIIEYLSAGVPVGRHLADQLVLLMALAGGGSFRTLSPSDHTITQRQVLDRFLGARAHTRQVNALTWEVTVEAGAAVSRSAPPGHPA